MSEKIYQSYRQQINILHSRGMVIEKGSQCSRAMRVLEHENYYNVINGYKELFLASPATSTADETYKPGTTFDEIYALYNFDRALRNIYLKYLLKLENTFKTVIAHEFSKKYGHDNYLKIENFYKNMKPEDKSIVSRQFNLQTDELAKFMHMLALTRNKCAHDERFFDIRFKERIHTKSIRNFSVLEIVRANDGSYTYGTNDAYAIAIMFALLLSKADLKEFISSMKTSFNKLHKQLHTISANNVMSIMGYDSNWTNLLKLL